MEFSTIPNSGYGLDPKPHHLNSEYHPQNNHTYENEYPSDVNPVDPSLQSQPVEGIESDAFSQYPLPPESNNSQDYQCNVCGKRFVIFARLQRHLRVHTGEKPFRCEFCDKTFSVKENLNVHRRIHTKVRPYLCNMCNRAFEHSGKLHRHMRTHTGERPHRCELCRKTFVQSGQLVIHMRAHTGEKPYVCEYCPKGFTCSKQLKVHLRTHTGEKPYACDICGKTFGYNHVLKMHKVSHLGKKLYKCTLCDQFFSSRKALDKHIKDHQETHQLDEGAVGIEEDAPGDIVKDNETENKKLHPGPGTYPMQQPSSPDSPTPIANGLRFSAEAKEDSLGGYNVDARPQSSSYTPEPVRYRNTSSACAPLTPPESPDNIEGIPASQDSSRYFQQPKTNEPENFTSTHPYYQARTPPQMVYRELPYKVEELMNHSQTELVFFTTITGERIACPVDRVIRLSGPSSKPEKEHFDFRSLHKSLFQENYYQETMKIREELETRLKQEEYQRQKEAAFFDSVLKVLESCIGKERLQKLGYHTLSLDDIIINTLKAMNTQACSEPSLSPMDRIKVNLRLLLECCVPDPELWAKFGWIGKSIEDIVAEFIKSNKESSASG